MSSSADVSPCHTPSGTPTSGNHPPKYGTVIPNRIFVGGIAANTTEAELKTFFTSFGAVKDSKIIADRAGVSKGYGFITFETQEDAEKIIKKEADNLVFKDRKLNIGPAIRKQQAFPRPFDPNLSTGSIMYSNGVPYTYQNGMAIFHAPEGGYPIPQPQPSYSTAMSMMLPQTAQTYMVAPQFSAYQPQAATPQWAATTGAWRWAPQSPTQAALTGSPAYTTPAYMYTAMHTAPELMYAQPPPHAYQPDLSDAAMLDGGPLEGGILPVDQSLINRMIVTESSDVLTTMTQNQPPIQPLSAPQLMTVRTSNPSVKGVPAAVYKKPVTAATIPRRSFTSPTILVKHGNKVQRIMANPLMISPSAITILPKSPESRSLDAMNAPLTPPPTPTCHG